MSEQNHYVYRRVTAAPLTPLPQQRPTRWYLAEAAERRLSYNKTRGPIDESTALEAGVNGPTSAKEAPATSGRFKWSR